VSGVVQQFLIHFTVSLFAVHVYGCTFFDNVAASGGGDVMKLGGTVTVHDTCPTPYQDKTPAQGAALQTYGAVEGTTFSYYCSSCQATSEPSHDGTGPEGNIYCINGGNALGFAPTCTCEFCDEGFGGPNCASCPSGFSGKPPDECSEGGCQATSTSSDDGADGNFFCINGGTASGSAGSCICTCTEGFSGTHCEESDNTISTMTSFFNAVSNNDDSSYVENTGTNIMTNGGTTVVADGHFKCSDGTCAAPEHMVVLTNMWGVVKCNSDLATCILDGEFSHLVIAVSGSNEGGHLLTIRALTVTKGKWDNCGGIGVSGSAIVDIVLCIFIENSPLASGGGAIGLMGGVVNVYGCTYYGNTIALTGGADVTNLGGSVTIHGTCPSPYQDTTPPQGAPLQTHGVVSGTPYEYSCSDCQASTDENHDGSDGSFYCINGGTAYGFAPTCRCLYCDKGYGGPNCASCPDGETGTPPNNCVPAVNTDCVATTIETDDGKDNNNFYCINGGSIGGSKGSCTCTSCNTGFSGDHCEICADCTETTPPTTAAPSSAPSSAPSLPTMIIDGSDSAGSESGSSLTTTLVLVVVAILVSGMVFFFFRKRRIESSAAAAGGGEKEKAQLAVVAPAEASISSVEMVAPAVQTAQPLVSQDEFQEYQEFLQFKNAQASFTTERNSTRNLLTSQRDTGSHEIDPSLLVNKEDLEFQRDESGDRVSLGRGAFGNVLVADYLGTKCAYKEVLPSAINEESTERLLMELNLIARLRHPNIVQCLGVVWEVRDKGILFELCSNGGLDEFMKKSSELNLMTWKKSAAARESQRQWALGNHEMKKMASTQILAVKGIGIKTMWALGIAKGCTFLHAKSPPIIHRDLKCANVLVTGDLSAKITDFGESKALSNDQNTMTTVGTPYFMAPEVFSGEEDDKQYSTAVDVYSFGMVLLEIFLNGEIRKAFKSSWGPMVIMNRINSGWRPDLGEVFEEDQRMAEIIARCWERDPTKRPTFKEITKFFKARQIKLEMETQLMDMKSMRSKREELSQLEEANDSKKGNDDSVSGGGATLLMSGIRWSG
jgi:serine/threonine protein kinase